MANTDNPRGLSPVRGPGGMPPRLRKYPAGTTTDIFRGDVVSLKTNGRIATVQTTTGSGTVIGVAANHIDASASTSAQNVWVYDDPYQEFEIQDDGDSGTPAQTSVGATAPLVITTGNTTTGLSKHELDISNLGTAATDPLLIEGFKQGPKFEIGKNASIIVTLNRHLRAKGSSGI